MEQKNVQQQTSGLAIASMICGIVSVIPLGGISIVLGIVAIILSVIAKSDITNNNKLGANYAKTGMICGIVAIVIWFLLLIIMGGTLLSFVASMH